MGKREHNINININVGEETENFVLISRTDLIKFLINFLISNSKKIIITVQIFFFF